jgi:hypothetical protein
MVRDLEGNKIIRAFPGKRSSADENPFDSKEISRFPPVFPLTGSEQIH